MMKKNDGLFKIYGGATREVDLATMQPREVVETAIREQLEATRAEQAEREVEEVRIAKENIINQLSIDQLRFRDARSELLGVLDAEIIPVAPENMFKCRRGYFAEINEKMKLCARHKDLKQPIQLQPPLARKSFPMVETSLQGYTFLAKHAFKQNYFPIQDENAADLKPTKIMEISLIDHVAVGTITQADLDRPTGGNEISLNNGFQKKVAFLGTSPNATKWPKAWKKEAYQSIYDLAESVAKVRSSEGGTPTASLTTFRKLVEGIDDFDDDFVELVAKRQIAINKVERWKRSLEQDWTAKANDTDDMMIRGRKEMRDLQANNTPQKLMEESDRAYKTVAEKLPGELGALRSLRAALAALTAGGEDRDELIRKCTDDLAQRLLLEAQKAKERENALNDLRVALTTRSEDTIDIIVAVEDRCTDGRAKELLSSATTVLDSFSKAEKDAFVKGPACLSEYLAGITEQASSVAQNFKSYLDI